MKEYNNFNSGIFIYIVEDNANSKLYIKVKSMNEDELEGLESVVARILRGGLKYSTRYYSSDNKHLVEYPHSGLQNAICIVEQEKLQQFWTTHAKLKLDNNVQTDEGNKQMRKWGVTYEESGMDYMASKKTLTKFSSYCSEVTTLNKEFSSASYPFYPKTVRNIWYGEYGNFFTQGNDGVHYLSSKEGYTDKISDPMSVMHIGDAGHMRFHTHPNRLPYVIMRNVTLYFKSKDCTGIHTNLVLGGDEVLLRCISPSKRDTDTYHYEIERPYDVVYEDGYYVIYGKSRIESAMNYQIFVPQRKLSNKIKLGLKKYICD
jgi:hypothetical protein